MERAKKNNEKFKFYMLTNGDTFKQLLARIRYFRYKNKSKWPKNQTERAAVLFELYLDIQKDYDLAEALRNIFEKTTDKVIGLERLAELHEKLNQSGFKSFNTILRPILNHYKTILIIGARMLRLK
jgi:transposase